MFKKAKSSSVDKKKQSRSVDSSENIDNVKAKRVGSKERSTTASSTNQQIKEAKRKSLNRKTKKSRNRRKNANRSGSSTENTYTTQDETSDDDEKVRQKRPVKLTSRHKNASREKTSDSSEDENAVQKRQKPKPLSGNVSNQQELTANNATDPIKTAQNSPRKRQAKKPDPIVKRPPTIEEPEEAGKYKFYRPFPNFYFRDSASTDGSLSNRTTRTDTSSPGVGNMNRNQLSFFRSDLPIDEPQSNVFPRDNKTRFSELPKPSKDDENEEQH